MARLVEETAECDKALEMFNATELQQVAAIARTFLFYNRFPVLKRVADPSCSQNQAVQERQSVVSNLQMKFTDSELAKGTGSPCV